MLRVGVALMFFTLVEFLFCPMERQFRTELQLIQMAEYGIPGLA